MTAAFVLCDGVAVTGIGVMACCLQDTGVLVMSRTFCQYVVLGA